MTPRPEKTEAVREKLRLPCIPSSLPLDDKCPRFGRSFVVHGKARLIRASPRAHRPAPFSSVAQSAGWLPAWGPGARSQPGPPPPAPRPWLLSRSLPGPRPPGPPPLAPTPLPAQAPALVPSPSPAHPRHPGPLPRPPGPNSRSRPRPPSQPRLLSPVPSPHPRPQPPDRRRSTQPGRAQLGLHVRAPPCCGDTRLAETRVSQRPGFEEGEKQEPPGRPSASNQLFCPTWGSPSFLNPPLFHSPASRGTANAPGSVLSASGQGGTSWASQPCEAGAFYRGGSRGMNGPWGSPRGTRLPEYIFFTTKLPLVADAELCHNPRKESPIYVSISTDTLEVSGKWRRPREEAGRGSVCQLQSLASRKFPCFFWKGLGSMNSHPLLAHFPITGAKAEFLPRRRGLKTEL